MSALKSRKSGFEKFLDIAGASFDNIAFTEFNHGKVDESFPFSNAHWSCLCIQD